MKRMSTHLIVVVVVATFGLIMTTHYASCELSLFTQSQPSVPAPAVAPTDSASSTTTSSSSSSSSSSNQDHVFAGGGRDPGGGGGSIDQNSDYYNRFDSDDKYDRLYLFPTSRGFLDDPYSNPSAASTTEKCSMLDKELVCKDYCETMLKQLQIQIEESTKNESSAKQSSASELIALLAEKLRCEKLAEDMQLNLVGVVRYYKSFVHSFLTAIKDKDENEDRLIYKLEVELSKHELSKLESFYTTPHDDDGDNNKGASGDGNTGGERRSARRTDIDTDALDSVVGQVHDVTDILKNMLVRVETNRLLSLTEKIIDAWQSIDLLNSALVRWLFAFMAISMSGLMFWRLNRRLPVYKSWRYFLIFTFFALFAISVYNNHIYLSQKKQIYNQQKLKELVPDECLAKDSSYQNKNTYSKMMSFIRYHFGYTATSKRCLDYQEALFIASGHNNYVESIVFTISESLKPIFISSGEFINQFYSALTKDLNFWQYIPLITLVTLVLLPVGLVFILMMSLLVFGYEFSFFFNLINLRRPPAQPAILDDNNSDMMRRRQQQLRRDELEAIMGTIRTESNRLVSNNVTLMISDISCAALQSHLIESSSDTAAAMAAANNDLDLLPIDESSSETLNRNIRRIFERINSREYELKSQLDNLRMENFTLKETLKSRDENERRKAAAATASKLSNKSRTTTAPKYTHHKETSSTLNSDNTQLISGGGGSGDAAAAAEEDETNMTESTASNATSNDGDLTTTSSTTTTSATAEIVSSSTTREVSIGLSRTVRSDQQQHRPNPANLEQDDEDDEIYVILDDN